MTTVELTAVLVRPGDRIWSDEFDCWLRVRQVDRSGDPKIVLISGDLGFTVAGHEMVDVWREGA